MCEPGKGAGGLRGTEAREVREFIKLESAQAARGTGRPGCSESGLVAATMIQV